MSMGENRVKCPNCGTSIDVQAMLAQRLEAEIRQQYRSRWKQEKQRYEERLESLGREKEGLKGAAEAAVQKKLNALLQLEREKIQKREAADMYGSIKGIAVEAIQAVKVLELPGDANRDA